MFTALRENRENAGKTYAQMRPAKAPTSRDLRAFELAAQGLSQRQVARVLGCSQPTVLRGIARATTWVATQDPDRQGERTWLERFRVATARYLILLEHESRKLEIGA